MTSYPVTIVTLAINLTTNPVILFTGCPLHWVDICWALCGLLHLDIYLLRALSLKSMFSVLLPSFCWKVQWCCLAAKEIPACVLHFLAMTFFFLCKEFHQFHNLYWYEGWRGLWVQPRLSIFMAVSSFKHVGKSQELVSSITVKFNEFFFGFND